jgi:hypothetical protein
MESNWPRQTGFVQLSRRMPSGRLVVQPNASIGVLARPASGVCCHKRGKDAIAVY